MNVEKHLLHRPVLTVLCSTALFFPFSSFVVQAVFLLCTGVHLRAGDAVIQMLWAGAVGVIGLLFFLPRAYGAFKTKQQVQFLKSVSIGIGLSIMLALFELWLHEVDRFCGGSAGTCGQWQ